MPLVRITLQAGRSPAVLRAIGDAIHGALVEAIGAPAEGSPDDLIVNLVEVPRENWSWGRGEATYAK
ncbi:MAG: tautomerase family protein [Planctomycetes bacterium]|nr:tautomerase family protein [Planctomycetota bacterium]